MFGRGQPKQRSSSVKIINRVNGVSHQVVTESMAMKLSAVFRCTQILSDTIGSIPLELKRNVSGVFVDETSTLADLLRFQPNSSFNSFEFKRQIVAKVLNRGNAFLMPVWDKGQCVELVLLSNNSCSYDIERHKYYVADSINKIYGEYDSSEIIHIKNMSLDGGYTGVPVIQYASRVLGIATSADEQSLDTFDGGTMIKGFVAGGETMQGFGAEQEEALTTIGDRIEGELRSGKNIISLPEGTDFRALQMTVAEAKLLEHREFSVIEICRFYGVDPERVFAGTAGNYKASESSQINFLNNTLNPILTQIESEFTRVLIQKRYRHRYKVEFDRKALFITDLTSKASYYKSMVEIGVFTVNEVRGKEGMSPVKGGDEAFISANLQSLKNPKVQNEKYNKVE